MKGIGKLYKERYQLQRFGRGGFIRLCLRTRTPIVPGAIVGAEETNPMLCRVEYLTQGAGHPVPAGHADVPAARAARAPAGADQVEDRLRRADRLRAATAPSRPTTRSSWGGSPSGCAATIQGMLDRAVGERRSVWFG